MLKKIVFGLLAFILIAAPIYFLTQKKSPSNEQAVLSDTLTLSKQYLSLRYQTDNLLINAESYADYEEWDREMTTIIGKWKALEEESTELKKSADEMAAETVSFNMNSQVYAYDKQEISNVFDKAPAGKKIATLATYLGVDAKRAYAILTQDQAQVTADAWNQAGDTFQKLESSAVVIKDGCKIAGYVGTIALTGGTGAIAAGSTIAKAAVVVSGADLVLEVTEDGAKIALGNHNKISAIVGDARKVTEPAAAILMISNLPKNLVKGIDKLNAVTFGAEQLNTVVQTGSVLGIKLPVYTKENPAPPLVVSVLKPEELEMWVTEQVEAASPETIETIEEILEINQAEADEEMTTEDTTGSQSDKENNGVLEETTWTGVLQNTAGGSQEVFTHDWHITFHKNGMLSGQTGESELAKWKQEGDTVLIFKEDMSLGYLKFEISGNTLVFSQIVIGETQISAGEEYMGGKALSGTLTKQ